MSKQPQGGERETDLHSSFCLIQLLQIGVKMYTNSHVKKKYANFANSTRSCYENICQTPVDALKMAVLNLLVISLSTDLGALNAA